MKTKNYYYQLAMTISQLQQQGKIVTIKQLPSTLNRRRRSCLEDTQIKLLSQSYYLRRMIYINNAQYYSIY